MKSIIFTQKSEYNNGTYTLRGLAGQCAGKWQDMTVWDYEKDSVAKDLKAEGYKVFEEEYFTPIGSFRREVRYKRI